MQGRASVGLKTSMLDDEEVSGCIRRDDLEGERAETEGMEMTGAVLTGRDGVEERSGRRFERALREDVMESHGGEEGRGGFEESAAMDGHAGIVRQAVRGEQ